METNTLAYYENMSFSAVKNLIVKAPLAIVIKLFTAVSYNFSIYARAFITNKPFQPSLMFAGKAGAFPSEAPFKCSTLGLAPDFIHKH